MASDVQKAVDIALKLTGIDAKQITPLVTAFKNLEKNIKSTQTSVTNLQKSLTALKTPTAITTLSKSLTDLAKVKLKDLGPLATNLTKLSKISAFPNIGTFVNNLQKLSSTSFAGLQGLTKQFQALISLNVASVVTKLRDFNTALAALEKRGGLASFAKFASDIKQMKAALDASQTSVKKMGDSLQDLGNKAQGGGVKLRTLGDKIKTVFEFRAISEGFMLLRQGISEGITAIIEYDQALKDLQAITGATDAEVAQMGQTILDVASTTKFSASEVATGMRTIAQAGFTASEAVQTMQGVADLATGTLSDMAQVVDLVTTAMRVFHIDASQSTMVVDVFANAVNRSKLTIEKLRTAMNYVGPVAHSANITFQETAAAMMTLANSGLRASTIGTSLRQVLAQLAAPSKKFRDAADEVGISLMDLDPTINSLSHVFQSLRVVLKDTGTAFNIFGKRGASAAIALTKTESQYDMLLETVSRTGTAAEQAAKQMEGLGVSFKNLFDKLKNLAIALGSGGIAKAMRVFVDIARVMVDMLVDLANTVGGKVVVSILTLTTVIAGLTGAFIALNLAFKTSAIGLFLGKVVSLTKAALTASKILRFMFSPLGIAITAIITLITSFYKKLTDGAKASAREAATLAGEYDNLGQQIDNYFDKIQNLAEGSNELRLANVGLRQEMYDVANSHSELADEALKVVDAIDPLTGEIDKSSTAIKDYQKAVNDLEFTKLKEAVKESADSLDHITSDFPTAVNYIKDVFDRAGIYFSAIWDTLINSLSGNAKESGKIWKKTFIDIGQHGTKIIEGLDLAESIREGTIAWEDLEREIKSWDVKNLTNQQAAIRDGFNEMNNNALKFINNLRESGDINLDDSIESFEHFITEMGLAGSEAESLISMFQKMKEQHDKSISGILDMWSKRGEFGLTEDLKEYEAQRIKTGKALSEENKRALQEETALRASYIEHYNKLEEEEKKLRASKTTTFGEWEKHWQKVKDLDNEVAAQLAKNSKDAVIQEKRKFDQIHAEYQAALQENEEDYRKSEEKKAKDKINIVDTYNTKVEALMKASMERIAAESTGISDGFAAEVDTMSKEFSELEKESEKAWKNIGKHSDSTFTDQQKAISDWGSTIQENVNSLAEKTQSTLYTLGENLSQVYRELGSDSEAFETIKKAMDDVKTSGIAGFEQLGEAAGNVLDHIASREEKLLDNIATYAQQIIDIQKEVDDILFGLEQKRMTASEKYQSDKLKAEELFKQAAIKNAEAESLSGEAAKKVRAEAVALAKEGLEFTKRLQSEVKVTGDLEEKIAESRERQNELQQELSKLNSSDEEDAKAIQKIQADINKEIDKRKGFQEELTASAKAYKDVQEGAAKAQKLITEASEDGIETEQTKLDLVGQQKVKWEELQKSIEETTEKLEAVEFNIDWSTAEQSLLDFENQIVLFAEEPREITFDVDPAGAVKDEIVKIGDTWTTVLTQAQTQSDETAKQIAKNLDAAFGEKEYKIGVAFEGSGSSTKPITEKIAEIKSKFATLVTALSKNIEVSILLKGIDKAIRQAKDLVKELEKIKPKTVVIKTRYETEGSPPAKKRWGGRLPGYGGGDKHPVLAESGEWFIRKEAVQKYGDSFFAALNSMSLPKFQDGGKVGASMLSSKQTTSSSVLDSLSNFGTVNLVTEGMSVPAIVHSDVITELSAHLNKMRRFGT